MKRILFYFGHPAQYLFAKNIIKAIRPSGLQIKIAIKSKDVLEELIRAGGEPYINVLPKGRTNHKAGIIWALVKREIRLFSIIRSFKPGLMIGSDPALAHLGKILKIPVITTLEDDHDVIPSLAKITYPFTSYIITPCVCKVGKWSYKQICYNGYMKLAYLHPKYFTADRGIIKNVKKYCLIRISGLKAYHDKGIAGLNHEYLMTLIQILHNHDIDPLISSENELPDDLKNYALAIYPEEIHHYIKFAELLISDSQSMSVEAAMLGTPSIRFSDFAGRISVLEELEKRYTLTFGFKTSESEAFFLKVEELIGNPALKDLWKERNKKMLSEKIDVVSFMTWFIEAFPESSKVMMDNPEYHTRFK